jgi:hypothetical protein
MPLDGATPQSRKIGIRAGQRIGLDEAPEEWSFSEPVDATVDLVGPGEPADIVIAFFRSAAELPGRLPGLATRIFPSGMVWIAWPRRASGHTSDITDGAVRESALSLGLVDTKVAALDEDWSALKFVWRVDRRTER